MFFVLVLEIMNHKYSCQYTLISCAYTGVAHLSQRPRYIELRTVMTQIPNISLEALDQYDQRLVDPNAQKVGDKKRKEQFKKLIAGTIGVMPHVATREQRCSCVSHCTQQCAS